MSINQETAGLPAAVDPLATYLHAADRGLERYGRELDAIEQEHGAWREWKIELRQRRLDGVGEELQKCDRALGALDEEYAGLRQEERGLDRERLAAIAISKLRKDMESYLSIMEDEDPGPELQSLAGRTGMPFGTAEEPLVIYVNGTPHLQSTPDADRLHLGDGSLALLSGEVALLRWVDDAGLYAILGADNAVAQRILESIR